MLDKKPKKNVFKINEFRKLITQKLRCTMPDCKWEGMCEFKSNIPVEKLHCPKCVNQSLEPLLN